MSNVEACRHPASLATSQSLVRGQNLLGYAPLVVHPRPQILGCVVGRHFHSRVEWPEPEFPEPDAYDEAKVERLRAEGA